MPVSHLLPKHYPKIEDGDRSKIVRALQKFIGETLKVKVIDLNQREKKLILSEKVSQIEKEEEVLKNYQIGDIVKGKITGITNFGAFIELKENVEGLLYSSEIPDKNKKKPEEILKIGQKVKVKIIKISGNQIYLSLKNL